MSYEEKGSWIRRPEKERGAVSDWAIGGPRVKRCLSRDWGEELNRWLGAWDQPELTVRLDFHSDGGACKPQGWGRQLEWGWWWRGRHCAGRYWWWRRCCAPKCLLRAVLTPFSGKCSLWIWARESLVVLLCILTNICAEVLMMRKHKTAGTVAQCSKGTVSVTLV